MNCDNCKLFKTTCNKNAIPYHRVDNCDKGIPKEQSTLVNYKYQD